MARQRATGDPRQLRRGKIIINKQRSAIDCKVWGLSDLEACLEVKSAPAIPPKFDLLITGEKSARHCVVRSAVKNRVTVIFTDPRQKAPRRDSARKECQQNIDLSVERPPTDLSRGSLVGLRSSLDEAEFGVVLLDADLRATFINRAFRKLWKLPDALTSGCPNFSDLMSHGRAVLAQDVSGLNEYVEEILTHVRGGDPTPVGMRLIEGDVLRFQCIALPHGGRMLSYTKVTDIVRRADECEVLRAAIDNVDQGIVIIDENLFVHFINRNARKMWKLTAEQCDHKPAYSQLINDIAATGVYDVPDDQLEEFVIKHFTMVQSGDKWPMDVRIKGDRVIRAQCTALPTGGRMLTHTDVTDLVHRADHQEHLAKIDALTGLPNRRNFLDCAETEWNRFRRYRHTFSILSFDIDRFKQINDGFGHDVGDRAIMQVADICKLEKRGSDVVARLGGDEFVVLMPETTAQAGAIFAERLRKSIVCHPMHLDGTAIAATVSIGVAQAEREMSGIPALMKLADNRLYAAKKAGRNTTVWADVNV
jgi:diguanylate cyclase (GGDEF)-like protein